MAIQYGLTPTGFVRKPLQVIKAEIEASWRAAFGSSIDVSPSTPDGQIIGIFAEREALVWELAEIVAGMMDPDKASDRLLEVLCLLTGTYRQLAKRSTVSLTLTGVPTTFVGEGSRAKTASTGVLFRTLTGATIDALTAWAPSTLYAAGDKRTNADRCYVCITGGVSDGSGGPTTTAEDITDGAAHWRYMGEGTGAVSVPAASVDEGPLVAVSGDITSIDTPVLGWSSVINLLDATTGAFKMSDQELRLLREREIAAGGRGPVPAIRRSLSRVSGVETVTVFYNNTDHTDADSVPPHSVEAMVEGGDDQDIIDALFDSVSGGIGIHGSGPGMVTGTHTDSQGTDHTIKFTRPELVPIYINITINVDPDTFPANGVDLVKLAIATWGDAQPAGRDARLTAAASPALDVPGVLDWDPAGTFIDDAPAPATGSTVPISLRQRASYDTSQINVTVVETTP